ncbi:MAG: hypothetical protein KatS3mg083_430 [Candidatus Dojkabacteria bacterium]|nr:MAG: hypothetical protein KatS3mg083_430 [Candidatus Dojkabacteria bacterium]
MTTYLKILEILKFSSIDRVGNILINNDSIL